MYLCWHQTAFFKILTLKQSQKIAFYVPCVSWRWIQYDCCRVSVRDDCVAWIYESMSCFFSFAVNSGCRWKAPSISGKSQCLLVYDRLTSSVYPSSVRLHLSLFLLIVERLRVPSEALQPFLLLTDSSWHSVKNKPVNEVCSVWAWLHTRVWTSAV